MKKIFFTLIAIIYSLNAVCQATQEGIGSVDFVENASKITKEQALDHIKKKFNNDEILISTYPLKKSEHQYLIKDVLVTLNFSRINAAKKIDINQKKADNDATFGREKTYHSEIRDIDGNQVLIMNRFVSDNVETFIFFMYKKDGAKAITGSLDFQPSDKSIAKTILEHMLSRAKFKD